MGNLTTFLEEQFDRHCPEGWSCSREVPLLSRALSQRLGYDPRADVVLKRRDGSRRLWIELEVSRADPVANHAKFAAAHLFQPQPAEDVFVAMVSAHVARGRRALAAHTVLLMRHLGMNAFQTVLLPRFPGSEIKRLNHSSLAELAGQALTVDREVDRALAVSSPVARVGGHRIHYAGDWLDVWANVHRWNEELCWASMRSMWGRRTITYFVFDPATRLFAPSKFCAFLRVPETGVPRDRVREAAPRWTTSSAVGAAMTVPYYVQLDEGDARFDGAIARKHLIERLAMRLCRPAEEPDVAQRFVPWLAQWETCVRVHPDGPVFLLPPGTA